MKMFWVEKDVSFGVTTENEEDEKFLYELMRRAGLGILAMRTPITKPEIPGRRPRLDFVIFDR